MDILLWFVIGITTGLVSKLVLPREDSDDWMGNLFLATAGAVLFGYMMRSFALGHNIGGYLWSATFAALLGSVGTMWVFGTMSSRSITPD